MDDLKKFQYLVNPYKLLNDISEVDYLLKNHSINNAEHEKRCLELIKNRDDRIVLMAVTGFEKFSK